MVSLVKYILGSNSLWLRGIGKHWNIRLPFITLSITSAPNFSHRSKVYISEVVNPNGPAFSAKIESYTSFVCQTANQKRNSSICSAVIRIPSRILSSTQ